MAISWLTVLKAVPWGQVIENAPKVADGARKLWNTVSGSPAPDARAQAGSPHDFDADTQAVNALESRLAALEAGAQDLHAQMLASSELIKHLAEQNAQLVARVEAHRRRILWLTVTAGLSLLLAAGALAIASLA